MKNLRYIVLGVLCAAVMFGAGLYFGKQQEPEPKVTSNLIESTLVESSDLITTKYHYSRVGKFENSLELNGWTIPLTNKNFILQFMGEIQAGIDVKKVEIAVNGDEIIIDLPPIQILNNILYEDSIEVYDEQNNVFNPIRVDDYKTFAIQQKEVALSDAKKKGLISEAEKQAQAVVKELVNTLPGAKDNYTITIHQQPSKE